MQSDLFRLCIIGDLNRFYLQGEIGMSEINIEEIMEQIRKESNEKGLDHEILSFESFLNENMCSFPGLDLDCEQFDLMMFLANLNDMNTRYLFDLNRPFEGNFISRTVKRIIRKMTRFYVQPLVIDQMYFNTYTVQTINSIRGFILQYEKEKILVNGLNSRINELEEKINKLQKVSICE